MMKYIRDLRLIPIAVIASACLLVLKLADLVLDRTMPANDQATLSDGDATVIRATPDVPRPGDAQRSWAQQMFNFPNAGGGASTPPDLVPRIAPDLLPRIAPSQLASDKNNADITGSVGGDGDDKSATKAQGEAPPSAEKDPPAPEPEPKPVRSGRGNMSTTRPNGTVILTDGPPPPPSAERAILERLSERRQESSSAPASSTSARASSPKPRSASRRGLRRSRRMRHSSPPPRRRKTRKRPRASKASSPCTKT